ncbi:MAG TPA: TatD family hydrolase [Mariprofundaceae bacterium]|nr:TatD family hydrolase [Mariprofundaceae bacterium]
MADISLVDTHCHPDFHQFDEDRQEVFGRMREAGVERIIAVSVELEQAPALQRFCADWPGAWYSVGVHPNHPVAEEPTTEEICGLAADTRCVAIGETGMDFFHHKVEPEVQAERFRNHIRAAKQVGKPVIVHMRDADEATLAIMAEEGIGECGGVMHCFSSGWEVASRALDLGMSISFSGNVTYKRNDELREVARRVPGDMLLVETDAPYLAPEPKRGKRNEPTYVRHVAECLASVRGMEFAEFAAMTTANACRRFGLQ